MLAGLCAPARRRPGLGRTSARSRRRRPAQPLAALGRVSVRAARAGPGEACCSPVRLPLPRSLARSLAPSLALPLRSGSAEGGGVGCRGGGGGGEAPAFLRSGRNLSQRYWSPEEPSCSPGAPPGLSLPARACWNGHGLGLELGAGRGIAPTQAASAPGGALGAGQEEFPIRGEGRAWERESPKGPEQTSRPPHAGAFATYPFSDFCLCRPGKGGALLETASSLRVRCGRDGDTIGL